MLAAFRALPLLVRLLTVAGLLAASLGTLGAIVWRIDQNGYQRATLEWTVKYQQREAELRQALEDEEQRQQQANADAKAAEEAELEVYRKKLLEMADLAQQLAADAAKDPNADHVALDADAVARHNRRID